MISPFRHPIQAIEALVHGHAAELAGKLLKLFESLDPGIKPTIDQIIQLVHDYMGPAVSASVDHALGVEATTTAAPACSFSADPAPAKAGDKILPQGGSSTAPPAV